MYNYIMLKQKKNLGKKTTKFNDNLTYVNDFMMAVNPNQIGWGVYFQAMQIL